MIYLIRPSICRVGNAHPTYLSKNKIGVLYIIDFTVTRGNKQAMIQSVWIVRNDENFPRLVTCYII